MNNRLFRVLVMIGACLLAAEVTLLTLPQRGAGGFGGNRGANAQAAPAQTPLPAGTASISGVVLSPDNRTSIEGVEILVSTPTAPRAAGTLPPSATAITDSSGRFSFKSILPGTYNVRARRDGFFGSRPDGTVAPMVTMQAVLTAAQPDATLEILMFSGATLTGRVVDSGGSPTPNAQVNIFQQRYRDGELVFAAGGRGQTNAQGDYRIDGVAPGQYFIRAVALGRMLGGAPAPPLITYFPSGRDPSDATLIAARAGIELVANIRLVDGIQRSASGRLMGATPPAGAGTVRFFLLLPGAAVSDNLESSLIHASASPDGTFRVETTRPDVYDLFAFASPSGVSGRTRVDLRAGDASGITLVLSPPADLEVRFLGDERGARSLAGLSLTPVGTPLPAAFRPRLPGGFVPAATAGQASQTFTNVPQGRYALNSAGGRGQTTYIADIRQDGKSILDDGVITVGEGRPAPVEVTIGAAGGTIEGTIQTPPGPAPTNVLVVAVPQGLRQQNLILYGRTPFPRGLRGGGAFRLTGLTPGTYNVFAFENLPAGAEENAEFMKKYESMGVVAEATRQRRDIVIPLIRIDP